MLNLFVEEGRRWGGIHKYSRSTRCLVDVVVVVVVTAKVS